jgi:short-subunit dehydrogenase
VARRSLKGKRILVTGASSGIGRALSLRLAAQGAHVLATARRQERLIQLQQEADRIRMDRDGQLTILSGDVTQVADRHRWQEWIAEHWGSLDGLVHNAGAGAIGPFLEASAERSRKVMEVDFFAVTDLTRELFTLLKNGDQPFLLAVGSVLAHRAVPDKSEYCAAKFALRGWCESVRVEWRALGVEVILVHPSTTRTEFFDRLIDTPSGTTSRSIGEASADRVASSLMAAIRQRKRDVVLSAAGNLLLWANRISPGLLDWVLARHRGQSAQPPTGRS